MRSEPILAMVCCLIGGALLVATGAVDLDRVPAASHVSPASFNDSDSVRIVDHAEDQTQLVTSVRTIRMKVTAYCLCRICCGKWADLSERKTSIGDDAKKYDGVAADPKLLPYRTRLEIPGLGVKEVDDTGGGMRQSAKKGIYHIDVRMPSHEAALRWGVRWLEVIVLSR